MFQSYSSGGFETFKLTAPGVARPGLYAESKKKKKSLPFR
jgi:hypothetical protein